MDKSFHELVTPILSGLGLSAPAQVIQTMLMRDGYFVGWKIRYDGGYAVLHASGSTIEVYDAQEQLLAAVDVERGKTAAA